MRAGDAIAGKTPHREHLQTVWPSGTLMVPTRAHRFRLMEGNCDTPTVSRSLLARARHVPSRHR